MLSFRTHCNYTFRVTKSQYVFRTIVRKRKPHSRQHHLLCVDKGCFQTGTCPSEKRNGKSPCVQHQSEKYLKVFLTDGEVPINDSATERALRNFTIGCKNWMTINTVHGAQASAVICSITKTARANGLNVYYYIKYLPGQPAELIDSQGNLGQSELEPLMPWSKTLPADCCSKRRN